MNALDISTPPIGSTLLSVRSAPTEQLRALDKLPEGFDAWVDRAQGWLRRRPHQSKPLWHQAQACAQQCTAYADWDDTALQAALVLARENLRRDPVHAKGQLTVALALVGQVAKRVKGMQPYPVQFMGALALHQGWLAEMATGEGKTLTVALAAVLAGWSGRPCHVITANDYLAERDADSMRPLYAACGVSLASVYEGVEAQERPARYAADVVYVTPKDLLADYLRDQLAAGTGRDEPWRAFQRWMGLPEALAQEPTLLVRGLHTAIVDEADSVLIDEAVTPLILSTRRPSRGLSEAVVLLAQLAPSLVAGQDYECTQRTRSVRLRQGAIDALDRLASDLPSVWRPAPRREELLRQALQHRCHGCAARQRNAKEVFYLADSDEHRRPRRKADDHGMGYKIHQGAKPQAPEQKLEHPHQKSERQNQLHVVRAARFGQRAHSGKDHDRNRRSRTGYQMP
jgi:preprotein translocase subunit SecA